MHDQKPMYQSSGPVKVYGWTWEIKENGVTVINAVCSQGVNKNGSTFGCERQVETFKVIRSLSDEGDTQTLNQRGRINGDKGKTVKFC